MKQKIEDLNFAIDGPPEKKPLLGDHDHYLVKIATIRRLMTKLAKSGSLYLAKFEKPPTYGFIGDIKPAFGQKFLDIAQAKGEPALHPDSELNDG